MWSPWTLVLFLTVAISHSKPLHANPSGVLDTVSGAQLVEVADFWAQLWGFAGLSVQCVGGEVLRQFTLSCGLLVAACGVLPDSDFPMELAFIGV